MPPERDSGYALVAAVMAMTAFAYIAYQVLAVGQGAAAIASGRLEQATLSAAADAGISLAIHGLAADDRGARWSIDGGPRRLEFGGVDLTVTVEDERGKVNLSAGLSDDQARALFAGAGATGDRLDALVAEFHDWQNTDSEAADSDLNEPPGPGSGPAIRHGPVLTIGELGALKDMNRAIFDRIAPVSTVFFEDTGAFDASHAQPLAQAAMRADDLANPDELDNEAQIGNERPDEELAPDDNLIGRTLTIRAVASDSSGARTHRMEIIELTGDPARPYWIRYTE